MSHNPHHNSSTNGSSYTGTGTGRPPHQHLLFPGADPMHPSSDDFPPSQSRPNINLNLNPGLPPLPTGLPPLPTLAAHHAASSSSSSVSLWSQLSSPSLVLPETPAKPSPKPTHTHLLSSSSSFRPVKRSAHDLPPSNPIGHVLVATPVYSSALAGFHSPAPVLVDSPSPAHAVPSTKKRRLVRRADRDAAVAAAAAAAVPAPAPVPHNRRTIVVSDNDDIDIDDSSSSSLPPPSQPGFSANNTQPSFFDTLLIEFPDIQPKFITRTLANTGHDLDRARAHLKRFVTAARAPGASALAAAAATNPAVVDLRDDDDDDDQLEYVPRRGGGRGTGGTARRLHPKERAASPLVPKATTKPPPARGRRRVHLSDSDDFDASGDSDASSNDDGDDDDDDDPATAQFFNSASLVELAEYLQCTPDQAQVIAALRPFASETDIANKLTATKSVSARMLEKYHEVNQALVAVEDVIAECDRIGQDLAHAMREWPDTASAAVAVQDLGRAEHLLHAQPAWLTSDLQLKAYQIVGVSWLALLHAKGLSGILADDMGLGKTAQVISYICHMHEQGNKGPFLVVCPSSTLDNWMREFGRWVDEARLTSGDMRVEAYVGSQAERSELAYDLLASRDPDQVPDGQAPVTVVVTTYNFATSKDDKKFLFKMKFAGMIVDEGHTLKNADSLRYKSLMAIKSAKFRLLLTGTPLQNNLQELLSLLTFILPDVFAHVASEWRTLLKLKSIDTISAQRLLRVKKVMAPFVLRRKKINVLADLPPKSVRIDPCPLTATQQAMYTDLVAASKQDLARGDKKQFKATFMMLRKAAIHPLLFRRHYSDEQCALIAKSLMCEEQYQNERLDYVIEDLQVMSDFEIHALCCKFKRLQPKYALRNNEWMDSAKVQRLKQVLDECKQRGDRCLLFSQFTMALDVLEEVMVTLGHKYLRIDGSTVVSERQPLIDKFYDDPDILVFLLSTKAGGQGLNLAAANVVILHDLDFNPHNDSQAEDRAWRLGQTKPVQVIKLVCKGTIEEVICERQQIKLNLDKKLTNAGTEPMDEPKAEPDVDDDNGPRKTDAAYEQEMMRLIATQLVKDVTDPAAAAQVDDGELMSMSGLGSEASSMRGDPSERGSSVAGGDLEDTASAVSSMSGW